MNKQTNLNHRSGFTVVELIIVIVVIAILAAISIVAYNGLTRQANTAAAQSSAQQAFKKITAYSALNGNAYPGTLADAGIDNSDSISYQYRVNNTSNHKGYCLTVTNKNVSYWVSNSSTSPTEGACEGHGVDGAAAPSITNLAADPRATAYAASNGEFRWETGRWFGISPATGTYSLVTGATDGPSGITTYARKTWSTAPASIQHSGDTGFNLGSAGYPVAEVDTYTFSCYLRGSAVRSYEIQLYLIAPNGSFTRVHSPRTVGPANTWTRLSFTYTIPSNTARVAAHCDSNQSGGGGAVNWSAGDTLDGTGAMVTKSSALYDYADGTSPGWTWSGTANSSTSTGPGQ